MPDEDLASLSPQEQIEGQKASCIFCKIVKGEIPSKEVYSDDAVLAILDINPAIKGHTLVLPKEHYPILPLVPPAVFGALFRATKYIAEGVKAGAVTDRATIFIANGGAAGQQSPHFLFHVVPRERGDGLDNFAVPTREVPREKIMEILPALKQNLGVLIRRAHGARASPPPPASTPPPGPLPAPMPERALPSPAPAARPDATAESTLVAATPQMQTIQVAELLEENSQLRHLLIERPGFVAEQMRTNPTLRALFAGINLQALSQKLRELERTRTKGRGSGSPAPPAPPSAPPPPAKGASGKADLDAIGRLLT